MKEKRELLYEGKAKKVYATDCADCVIVDYKDDATAFNGLKKGTISGKGVVNNRCSNLLFRYLEKNGIPTHYIEELSDRETLVKSVQIVPIEVIIRNVCTGSMTKRLGVEDGKKLRTPILEYCYKNDEFGDPLINDYHAIAMELATEEELAEISDLAFRINHLLKAFFEKIGIDLIDFKLEFGRYKGKIVLADEISPDTCRFWDKETGEKLDKDRFRKDLGGVEEAYQEIMSRLGGADA